MTMCPATSRSTTTIGDADAVAAAFAKAAHVTRLKMVNNRVIVNAMEPRAAVGAFENGRFTLHTCSQGVVGMKANIAALLNVEPKQVRVVSGNVGGSFGMKAAPYPEYVCVLHAARALGRPVKWTDERSGSFVSDSHGRDHRVNAELALDAEGHFLAVRLTIVGNMGGFLANVGPMPSTQNAVKNVQSVYRTPLIEVSTKCVFTNSTHVSAYRGAGRPEGNYYMERLIDTAAAEIEIDRLELRRRNHIRPRELPFKAPLGGIYDSGEFPAIMKEAIEAADAKGFRQRKRESRKRGKLRGLGIGSYLEVTAPSSKELGGVVFEADGSVTILTGTLDFGMGHATPFAQVLHQTLGIPFEKIRLMQTDSDRLPAGGGSGGSKSLMHTGTALVEASAKIIDQGKVIASHVLEASAGDIEFKNGNFVIAGTDRAIGIMELAAKLRSGINLPDGVPTSLDIKPCERRPERLRLSQRLPCLRGRDRSRHRRGRGGQVFRGQRLRHRGQSDDRRGPAPRRRGARHRPGADGAHGLRRRRASCSPAPSWTTRCRARSTRRCSTWPTIRCPPRPIRSASKAAAKPAAPDR